MLFMILTVLAGCVPPLLVFFWLRGYLHKENALYKKNCNRMLTAGFLTIFPVMLLSVCIVIPLNVSELKTSQPLLYAALFTFGTYALSEELAKFYMFRRRLKILDGEHSRLDMIAYATIIGIGFGLLESIVFVATSGPFDMLIRGIRMRLTMIAMRRWTVRCQSPFFLWASARVRS